MRFEWDEAKREANLRKHGIDFIGIAPLFEGYTVTIEDERFVYGEQRFVTFGVLKGRVVGGRPHRKRRCDPNHLDQKGNTQ